MCFDTALSDISNGAAMSVTRVGPRVSRSTIARLVGSASAVHTASVVAGMMFNLQVEYDASGTLVKPRPHAEAGARRQRNSSSSPVAALAETTSMLAVASNVPRAGLEPARASRLTTF